MMQPDASRATRAWTRPGTSLSAGRASAGLTIVEILVTLVIIGLMFGPIFAWIVTSSRAIYWGGDETLATIYASDVIEVIRGAPYDAFFWKDEELNMTLQDIYTKHPIPQRDDLKKYDERFTILADVTVAGDIPPKVMKMVRVRVAWKDKSTQNKRELKLVTFYGPPD
ncbi:MAG: hypothetical protein HY814_13515 [Candidatus Riflebacteria bacterium]|nr:hypothetical protein [Candidatus Riflebacteria bacterium]